MEGLSFSGIGNLRVLTPVEMAIQTELSSKIQAETVIKKIDNAKKTQNDKDRDDKKKRDLQGRYIDDEKEEAVEQVALSPIEKSLNKYKVKLNSSSYMVELIDQTNGKVMESIAPDDLLKLVSKTRNPSGILFDKEV